MTENVYDACTGKREEMDYRLIFFDTATLVTEPSLGKVALLNLSFFCNTIRISNLLPSRLCLYGSHGDNFTTSSSV